MHRPVVQEMSDSDMESYLESFKKLIKCFRQHFPDIISEKDETETTNNIEQVGFQFTVSMFMSYKENGQRGRDGIRGFTNLRKS